MVYIPTINHMHFENAKLALNHGKHVLVEKPMTLSEEHTAYLFKLAKKKNLFIMEAQKSVFLPITLEVKEKIKEGIIGKVHFVRYTMSYPEVGFDWFYDVNKGGGALYGNAGYILSHSSYILNQDLVQPSGLATLGTGGIDLACILNIKTPEGILIQGQVTTLLDMVSQAEFYGDKGKITIKDFWKAREAIIEISGEKEQELSHPIDYEMVYEVDHVNECIENGILVSPVMSDKRSIDIAKKIDLYHEDFKR
ncbi:MAG: Gfo/Idh/MocA family oxidoreductase [Clostridium sp.]|nr:Gfo/Idh/MocA family oxidoreductase [Clostridium sp.]